MNLSNKDLKRKKAEFAFGKIKKVQEEEVKKFKGHIKTIPSYIYSNGLIATLAFIIKKSKEKNGEDKQSAENKSYALIGKILGEYLCGDFNEYACEFNNKKLEGIVEYLIGCDPRKYRRITLNILSFLEWLIRFADAMIEDEVEDEGENNG